MYVIYTVICPRQVSFRKVIVLLVEDFTTLSSKLGLAAASVVSLLAESRCFGELFTRFYSTCYSNQCAEPFVLFLGLIF